MNHRIYEYSENGDTRGMLEDAVNRGYSAHLESWKNVRGLAELARTMVKNRTARTAIANNIMNPDARKRISDGRRFRQDEIVAPVIGHSTDHD
jgi:hypothetical protein